jgi:hypothetical protein
MDIPTHKAKFDQIIKKYNLDQKAEEISTFLTKKHNHNAEEFATLFAMNKEDAHIFLSFVQIGIKFKEKHIDNKE